MIPCNHQERDREYLHRRAPEEDRPSWGLQGQQGQATLVPESDPPWARQSTPTRLSPEYIARIWLRSRQGPCLPKPCSVASSSLETQQRRCSLQVLPSNYNTTAFVCWTVKYSDFVPPCCCHFDLSPALSLLSRIFSSDFDQPEGEWHRIDADWVVSRCVSAIQLFSCTVFFGKVYNVDFLTKNILNV